MLSVGILGLFVRYGQAAGGFGRTSLGLGVVSGVVSALGVLSIFGGETGWWMFFLGLACMLLGIALFGIACLRRSLLPTWTGMLLITGFWLPLFVLIATVYEAATTDPLNLSNWIMWPLFMLNLLGLIGAGYQLQSSNASQEAFEAA